MSGPTYLPRPFHEPDRLAWLMLTAALGWAALLFLHSRHQLSDAGYLHLVFARSLSDGKGLRFGGQLVNGDVSPLWLGMLVCVHSVVRDWVVSAKLLSAIAVLAAISGIFAFGYHLTRVLGRIIALRFAGAMSLLFVLEPVFAVWAFNGTEYVAAAGLACWLVVLTAGPFHKAVTYHKLLVVSLCSGLAPLLRPELALLSLLIDLLLFRRWVELAAPFRTKLLTFFACFALVLVPTCGWLVTAARTFHSLLPASYAASGAAPNRSVLVLLLQHMLTQYPLVLFCCGAFVTMMGRALHRKTPLALRRVITLLEPSSWLLIAWVALLLLAYLVAHTNVQSQDLLFTLPAATVVGLALLRRVSPGGYRAALLCGLLYGTVVSLLGSWPLLRNEADVESTYADLAHELAGLPATQSVAAWRTGELAFLSRQPVIDMSGHLDDTFLPYRWDVPENRRVWQAHERGAQLAVLDHDPEPDSRLLWSREEPSTVWSFLPGAYRTFDRVMLWRLPPSPTLPLSPEMQMEDTP